MWLRNPNALRGRAIVLLAVAALGCAAHVRAALEVGQPLPALADYGLTGELPALRGKVVLLDFWASWCAPCKASFPAFSELQRELGPDGLVILGVSVDQREVLYRRFLEQLKPAFATVWDDHQKLVSTLTPPAMPTSFLFGRDGRLRSVHTGFHGDRTIDELRAELRPLLEEKAP